MRKTIQILAVYTILISLYAMVANFSVMGRQITVTSQIALITLVTFTPIIIFAVLAILYLRK